MSIAAFMASCGSPGTASQDDLPTIDTSLTPEEIAAGVFTPQIMWKMGRVGGSQVSPDGTLVVYQTTYYNVDENRGLTNIYRIGIDGGEPVMLASNASDPQWSRDGNTIYFLADSQAWSMAKDGTHKVQLTDVEGGIDAFGVSPDNSKLFYTKGVAVEKRNSADIYPDMDKSKAKIYDDLMARHWNYWDEGKYSHIFVADLTADKVTTGKDIMEQEPWDAPLAPYFDASEIAWSNNSRLLAYTCKKLTGSEYAISTDSDIFIYDTVAATTVNICKSDTPADPRLRIMPEMAGYDKYPVFSPDDSLIALRSMRRPGNESDKERLLIYSLADGTMHDITPDFDYNATNVVWVDRGTILFVAPYQGTHQIFAVSISPDFTSNVQPITSGDHDINAFSLGGDKLVAEMTKISQATELFNVIDGELKQLTFVNKQIYDNIPLGKVEKRWVKTTDSKDMLTWVVLPPNFDQSKKYPVLLFCEGGPQSVVSQFWSYRWNFELMAAQGYIVVAPNRRGVPSFGQEWLDQISGDYSGQNIKDYLSAVDNVAAEPWADGDRMGCVGASYGGYSVYFLAGCHEGRFKAFISHCGIFDFDSMYGSTEELWFVNNDYGGSYWDQNPVARRSYANSPHKTADKWDTPIMIITGLNDFRIPYTQSLEAFTAARVRGVPARLVAFENEAHQVFKPQNSLVWNREFFGWLDKYVKNPKTE